MLGRRGTSVGERVGESGMRLGGGMVVLLGR